MAELNPTATRRLRSFGYTNQDIAAMTDLEAAEISANKKYKPGSKRAAAAVASSIGMPGLPHSHTDEGIAEANKGKTPASAYVIRSDYEADLQARAALRRAGSQVPIPTDEIAAPWVEANPDRAFRWMTSAHCAKRDTRGWQPVYDTNGKRVTHLNEKRWLAQKPKDVRDAQLAEYREQDRRARAEVREHLAEQGRKAEVDSGGGIRILPPEHMTRLVEGRGNQG